MVRRRQQVVDVNVGWHTTGGLQARVLPRTQGHGCVRCVRACVSVCVRACVHAKGGGAHYTKERASNLEVFGLGRFDRVQEGNVNEGVGGWECTPFFDRDCSQGRPKRFPSKCTVDYRNWTVCMYARARARMCVCVNLCAIG